MFKLKFKDLIKPNKKPPQSNSSQLEIESLINNLPMISYVIDKDRNFIMGNKKSYTFYSKGIDLNFENVSIDLAHLISVSEPENKQIYQTRETITVEQCLKSTDGGNHWYSWRKSPWITIDGEIKGIIVVIENIDAQKHAYKQRDNYISTLSHDLKTPTLAQIRMLEMFLNGTTGELNDKQKELLKLMLDSSNYMYSMVDILVSTYKYENNEIKLNYTSFDIKDAFENAIKALEDQIKERETNIHLESNIKNTRIYADEVQLKRGIYHILLVAISCCYKNTPINVMLYESIENGTEKVKIKIENYSPYLSNERIKNLFKRYVSHADKFNRVGAGLGLYLFKLIIDAHQGNIFLVSSPRGATVLTVTLDKNH